MRRLKDIAKSEGVCSSYVSRLGNPTTLAPDIVAAILDDGLPDHVSLLELAVDPATQWEGQKEKFTLAQ